MSRDGSASFVRRAVAMEAAGWVSMARFVRRRPRVGAGATAVPYVGALRTVLLVFIGLSALEIVVLDLILQAWPVPRVVLLLLGVWGLAFMLGLTAGMVVNPHEVGPRGIRLRYAPFVDVLIPWQAVDSVAACRHGLESGATVQVEETAAGVVVSLAVQSQTTAELRLERPTVLGLPRGPVTASVVRFHVDDTRLLLTAVREHLRAHEQAQVVATGGTGPDRGASGEVSPSGP